jgi:hypothetical protein
MEADKNFSDFSFYSIIIFDVILFLFSLILYVRTRIFINRVDNRYKLAVNKNK